MSSTPEAGQTCSGAALLCLWHCNNINLRSAVTNIPVPSTRPIIHQLKKCFSIELHHDIAATLKIMYILQKVATVCQSAKRNHCREATKAASSPFKSLKHEERVKRGRPSEFTPTPVKRPVQKDSQRLLALSRYIHSGKGYQDPSVFISYGYNTWLIISLKMCLQFIIETSLFSHYR